jgi:hypothetical protein
MIRNDYLNKFIGYELYKDSSSSTKLGVPWHYVIVDIKHSLITLNSDGIHIRNQDSIPAYKGQLLIYTQALNEIQGTRISKAFILGKKYIYECKGVKFEINNLMNKMGIIDYANVDKHYIDKLDVFTTHDSKVPFDNSNMKVVAVVDLWEHAFYLDYPANKKKYLEESFKILNWKYIMSSCYK